ncbi:MAG: tetratricopeptide repeat protein [Pseudomonadales bacterium]
MRTWHWLLLCVVLFASGLVMGKRWGATAEAVVLETAPPAQVVSAPAPKGDDVLRVAVPGFAEAVAARDWQALVGLLESASFENRDADHAALYAGMRAVAADLVAADAVDDAQVLLESYAALNPQDHEIRFELAQALQQDGRFAAALQPVFEVLDAPLTFEDREAAEQLRDSLIIAEVERLELEAAVQGEPASVALVAFYESLSLREPINDSHRAALVEVLLADGQVTAAAHTLNAMAGYGVPLETIEALQSQINLQQDQSGLESRSGSLYASASAAGTPLNLLLDTGATQTALTPAALDRVRARPVNRTVRVRTAGGEVTAPLFELEQFEFAGTRLAQLQVIALRELPGDVDGLLGMDVLNQVGELALDQP